MLFLCSRGGYAQESVFRTVSVENGLSNNFVRKIYKDSRGYVWVGTLNGLERFDGLSFKSYIDVHHQKGNVYDVLETSPDYLWVATDKGLWRLMYDDEQLHPVDLQGEYAARCLARGENNQLLVGTSRGMFVLSGTSSLHVLPDDGRQPATNTINAIYPDGRQSCWLATAAGLLHCDYSSVPPRVIAYHRKGNNSFWSIASIGPDLFLGTHGDGLIKFDVRRREFVKVAGLGNDHVLCLHAEEDNYLWVGTDGNGLKKISIPGGKVVTSYVHKPRDPFSIGSNAVYAFLKEGDQTWVGTYSTGISYSINRSFRVYSHDNFSTRGNHVRSFLVKGKEKLVGTRDGFFYVNEEKNIVKHYLGGLPGGEQLLSNTIIFIFPFEGRYLLGTLKGLVAFHPDDLSVRRFHPDTIFSSTSFYGCTVDRDNHLWLATFSGVICLDPATGTFKQFTTANSDLPSDIVHSIKVDSKNRVWIGTKEGICFHAEGSVHPLSALPPGACRGKITHVHEDRNANIWFCTEDDGLYAVDGELLAVTHYTLDDHLPDKSVSSIMEDEMGFFWVATHKGLARCTFTNDQYRTFWISDGLPGLMFNPGACYHDRDNGMLWWGNENGLVYREQPYRDAGNPGVPVQLTGMHVNGREVPSGSKLLPVAIDRSANVTLDASCESFGFDLVALNYIYPNDNTFETKLDGLDDRWKSMEKGETSARYDNPGPGKYLFRARLAGYPESERSVTIIIKRSWKALWGAAGVVILIAWWWYWKRPHARQGTKEKQKQDNAAKKRPVKDNPALQQMLLQLMEEKKPFLDPGIKISHVATALKCTPLDVSRVLNTTKRQGFADFVNGYRVNEFKRKVALKEHEKFTLVALSGQCGFNSRSSFFRIFKHHTGMTPVEYLKQHPG
jgi:ligand-binding sensor domain-containing protein/AraC-like DNA-binding protein